MIQARRFSHATFETPDIDRQIDYFTQVAGLGLAERLNGRAFLATRLGDLVVQLEKGEQSRCARLAFQTDPDTEFDDIRRGLEAEDVRCEVRNDASPGISKIMAFSDPKGTVCEVFANQTPIAKKQQAHGIGPLKLGHLAFVVQEPKVFAEFYGRVLGFRVSDWIEDWFVFMRCGPDHHTINFVRGKRTHGPGHNVYTYHRNPDDQIIEMFTELDKMLDESLGYFDPKPWHRERPQKPKVWTMPTDIWGPPPTSEYTRQRD
jgi:catechol 2,3-dioxygenase-like lactoylglutathione lyase family enzyme